MEELQVEDKWGWIEKKEFPKLPRINQEDMEGLISSFSTGKGIAYDGTSDKLFEKVRSKGPQSIEGKTHQNVTAKKLYDYLDKQLDRAQTGFVRGVRIQVNLTRSLGRIRLRTKESKKFTVSSLTSPKPNSVHHTLPETET